MEQSLNGIVVVDAQRRYSYVNPAGRRATGYRLGELVGCRAAAWRRCPGSRPVGRWSC